MQPVTELQQQRIERQLALLAQARAVLPRARAPYSGHMRLYTGSRYVDVLLGNASRTGTGFSVIDWQTAPLAEVFFAHAEGEDYELEVEGRTISGRLVEKNLLTFRDGALVRVDCALGALTLEAPGTWAQAAAKAEAHLPPRPLSARRPFLSPLRVKLDAAQQRLVDLPASAHLLILGEAGFGKTTVALQRLLSLQARAGRSFRAAVVVPTEGLRRLTHGMLEREEALGIDVFTYEQWAAKAARRAFPGLPRRESSLAPPAVTSLKRHGALRPVLEAFARKHPRPHSPEEAAASSRALARRNDLEHLFGDSAWMAQVVAGSGGALSPLSVAQVCEHTRVQYGNPSEMEYAHVDADRLETVDGRRMDEATPDEDAGTIDIEDYAVLFELERLRAEARAERPAKLQRYHCLLLDEAQEFAPLELALLGRSLAPGGSLLVAGDAAQQVDPTSHFMGWEQTLQALGAGAYERAVLAVSYRCPPEVTALARSVLGAGAGPPLASGPICVSLQEDRCHLGDWLTGALRRLGSEDPSASVAVIARSTDTARKLAVTLGHGLSVRLALEGDFLFRPGVTVTSVEEVKGLEFDCVVLPDVQAAAYPDTPASRRALYVGVTRTLHGLGLSVAGAISPLLRPMPGLSASGPGTSETAPADD